jgi:hypothetical protein
LSNSIFLAVTVANVLAVTVANSDYRDLIIAHFTMISFFILYLIISFCVALELPSQFHEHSDPFLF